MEERQYKLVTVTVPVSWMSALDKCRGKNGNTRAGELRQALQAHLVKNGFMSKNGIVKEG